MSEIRPASAQELARALRDAAENSRTVSVFGNRSKHLMAGPELLADVAISTACLRRVLQYEPNDLTISVEAGMSFRELKAILAERGQMLALDPPFSDQATIGGIVASNSSGPMRRAFGTARDLVIGMTFATAEGKLVKTGGMVVKNVAGLDMGKLMIGSFGTLAVITTVNFRVHSLPPGSRTFLFSFADLDTAIEKRNSILQSVLQPIAIDLLSPAVASAVRRRGYVLAVRAGGNARVLERYERELAGSEPISNGEEATFWRSIREFSPEFLGQRSDGIVLRVSHVLSETGAVFRVVPGACISRAGSGVTYVYLTSWEQVAPIWQAAAERGWSAVVEFAPDEVRRREKLWLTPRSDQSAETFAIMKRVKEMFDPKNLLNRSRLYGRI
jgi:glycolate oxidase FAD binding subunit